MNLSRFAALLSAAFFAGVLWAAEPASETAPAEADLRALAQQGDAQAMVLLGKRYFRGESGAPQNYSQAAYWFRQAAEAGSVEGIFNYAVCLHRGLGVEVDLREALRQYRKASAQGLLPARLMEAAIYQNGIPATSDAGEIPPDPERALETLDALAQTGYAPGMRELAKMLLPSDEAKGFEWLTLAADADDIEAKRIAAGILLQGTEKIQADPDKAVRYLREAAAAYDPQAAAQLAFCLEYGIGTTSDTAEAMSLYRIAADAGNAGAQVKVGEYLLHGNPPEQEPDPLQAVELFRKAAEANHPAALFRLAICYLEGFGVKADPRVAADYFLAAANLGDVRSQYNLACLYLSGEAIPGDEKAAFYWFRRAAEAGDAQAQRQLAICFFEGTGTNADDKAGLFWLRKAAEQGDPEAVELLGGEDFSAAPDRSVSL